MNCSPRKSHLWPHITNPDSTVTVSHSVHVAILKKVLPCVDIDKLICWLCMCYDVGHVFLGILTLTSTSKFSSSLSLVGSG